MSVIAKRRNRHSPQQCVRWSIQLHATTGKIIGGSKRLSIWRDFCFNRTSTAQTPVELRCIGRLRLATGHAGDLR